jgi:poly-gamma-glutamate capsule biosynthesis protein CapA/YwtB (metallophosphatase superfamily)
MPPSIHSFVRERERWRACAAVTVLLFALTACAARAVEPPASDDVRVVAVGDIMLGGTATPELVQFGYDYPFANVRDLLHHADVVFGNLEGPLTDRGTAAVKEYVFHSPPQRVAPALARAGFNVVSLANNHSMDYGLDGLRDTIEALRRAGIAHAGAGENLAAARHPALIQVGAVRVAVLAYSLTFPEEFWANGVRPGTAFGHESQVRADVAVAKKTADVVLVSFHWGRERTVELRDYQRKLGHAAIDAGAAAVIGHHPHVLQGIERYRGGVILYSLGNFVFGSYSRAAARSVVARFSLRRGRVHALELYPINVLNVEVVFRPSRLHGAAANEVVTELQRISRPFGTVIQNREGVAVVQLPEGAN